MLSDAEPFSRTSHAGLTACCFRLAGFLTLALVLVTPLAYLSQGINGALSALVAGGVCLAAAIAGLIVSEIATGSNTASAASILGIIPRMAIPLITCIVIYQNDGPLVEGKLAHYIVFFYLVALAAETTITVVRRTAMQEN